MISNSKSFEDAINAPVATQRAKRLSKRIRIQALQITAPTIKKNRVMDKDDSDDDFEIVSFIDSMKWFYPTDKQWQLTKCAQFNLSLKKEIKFNIDDPVPATTPKLIHGIDGDGNCYFRCLSYVLTGADKSHRLLRQNLVKFMRANEKLVEGLGGPNYINNSLMWTEGMWPTEVEIYASACMLDTDIYTFVDDKWLRFSSNGKLEIPDKIERAIYLQNTDKVHYDVVLQVNEPKILPPRKVYGSTRSKTKRPQSVADVSEITSQDADESLEIKPPLNSHTMEPPPLSSHTMEPPPQVPLYPTERLDLKTLLKEI